MVIFENINTGGKEMKKTKIFSFILALCLVFTSFTATISAKSVDKNNGEDAKKIVEDAKKNDKKALEFIKGLDCFKADKVNAKLSNLNVVLSDGNPTYSVEFDDGSKIVYTYESNEQYIGANQKGDSTASMAATADSRRTESVKKTYYYLFAPAGSITCNADVTYVSRTNVHINSVWPDAWSLGSVSDTGASILDNNITTVYCEAHGKYSLAGGIAWSELMNVRMYIDSTGLVGTY